MMYSASAFAANTIVRSAVGAAFPLFTVQMFTNVGVPSALCLAQVEPGPADSAREFGIWAAGGHSVPGGTAPGAVRSALDDFKVRLKKLLENP